MDYLFGINEHFLFKAHVFKAQNLMNKKYYAVFYNFMLMRKFIFTIYRGIEI